MAAGQTIARVAFTNAVLFKSDLFIYLDTDRSNYNQFGFFISGDLFSTNVFVEPQT